MKAQHKQYLITAIVVIIVGAVAFYGGMKYQKNQTPADRQFLRTGANGQMMGGRQARSSGAFGGRMGGGAVVGEILSQDDTSITVKDQDGSSKIVLLSEKTTINTASAAAKTDLKVGATVSAFGATNPDGSVTATTIQLNSSYWADQN